MVETFTGVFTQQEPIPEAGIAAALDVMRHGRLHRYNVVDGDVSEVAALEQEFAAFTGASHCVAVASGGYALGLALRALSVGPGDPVLTNAFTLAPVPGAIASVGARPVFVETTDSLTIDLDHLAEMATSTGARVLVLSHMRGHQPDMSATLAVAERHGLTIVEDCAHTMGGAWGGTPSGRHGTVACYSTQTYKHINSGEGGLLTTDHAEIAARAILLSGSYMLYDRNGTAPDAAMFEPLRNVTPNVSGRMDALRAAILRPQLAALPQQVARWAALHDAVEAEVSNLPHLRLIPRDPDLVRVGSSFQFRLPQHTGPEIEEVVSRCKARGVELKWFGAPRAVGYTSMYHHWAYAAPATLPKTDDVVRSVVDMRLPLTFSTDDARLIGRIIRDEVRPPSAC